MDSEPNLFLALQEYKTLLIEPYEFQQVDLNG